MTVPYVCLTIVHSFPSEPVNVKTLSPKLIKADYHGAIITGKFWLYEPTKL